MYASDAICPPDQAVPCAGGNRGRSYFTYNDTAGCSSGRTERQDRIAEGWGGFPAIDHKIARSERQMVLCVCHYSCPWAWDCWRAVDCAGGFGVGEVVTVQVRDVGVDTFGYVHSASETPRRGERRPGGVSLLPGFQVEGTLGGLVDGCPCCS
jgi:hypothetical protein